tara:strand:- start:484 stop:1410 length:927 start_codon:yes stop_codon:yes gene_type:complete
MEREIAVIKPKGVNHIKQAVTLTATYSLKGRSISLNQYGEVKPGNLTTNRGDIRFAGELATESKIFGESVEDAEDEIDFWMNHPMVEDINGKGKDSSRFTIEVIAATKDKKRAKTVNVNRVVSTVYGMTQAERKDVMYFFKQDPRDMNDDDVTLTLVDIEGGLLLREPNTSRFIETFGSLNKQSVATKVEMLVYVNKGIVSGFVTEDADKFYIGDVLIGKDEDDIALFFKDNPQMYDNLVRSLAKDGDDTAFNEMNESDDDITPAEKKEHFTKLYKKYKLKGKFPSDLDKAIERIHAYELENGIELSE